MHICVGYEISSDTYSGGGHGERRMEVGGLLCFWNGALQFVSHDMRIWTGALKFQDAVWEAAELRGLRPDDYLQDLLYFIHLTTLLHQLSSQARIICPLGL